VLADNWLTDLVVPICAAARERGIPVVIDGDGRMSDGCELLRLASHVVFSAEALRATAGHEDLCAALAWLGAGRQTFLAATDGADDILWWDGRVVQRLPVFAIEAVDTLTAGDVFHGAFVLALAQARREVDALRFAAAAAALKCSRFGGGAAAPTRAEVETLLGR
jgi:sugar/nucleoside kinase (ribokinase family)